MRRFVSSAILAFLTAVPASAAGGVWCDADDRHATISVHAPMSRSGGVYTLEGTLRLKQASVPAELGRFDLRIDHLRHAAVGPRRVAMKLRRQHSDRSPQLVELEIDVSGADGEYEGRYVVVVHNGPKPKLKLTGSIACGAE
jgi:hypothetical protein